MPLTHPVRVSLIGLGALGILHARDLASHPDLCTLTCIADTERQKRYAREGIFCNNIRLDLSLMAPEEKPEHKADLVMVCVKATGLEQTIRDIANHVGEGTIIISLLNGVTSEDMLRTAYPMARVIHCIAQGMDALRVDQKLACSQHGKLVIGTDREELQESVQELAGFFERVGIPHMVDKDILHRLYAKWMFNCGINQTITVFEGTYGTLQHEGEPREVFKGAMREVRMALLEADVALPVVREFINRVKEKAVGHEVNKSLTPGQEFVKIVRNELVAAMGEENQTLNLAAQPPAVVLMAGLQGAGKTTSVGKLGKFLREKHKKKVLVVSADVYRPAAIKQLETLAEQVGVDFFPSDVGQKPVDIVNAALKEAKLKFYDVLLVDTAGRLHVDEAMMDEIKQVHASINPVETLFVVDAMTGQDAANTAKAFNEALPLTGVVLTKVDGDARGGAALSIRHITGKPIKFLGVGEKTEALEPFHPDRIASRILGMGDVLSLIEDIESKVDRAQAEKLASKLKKGDGFDLNDFLEQLRQMKNMGGMASLMGKLPGMGQIPDNVKSQMDDKVLVRMEAIINSMTMKERAKPEIIKGSRKRRIAAGCGMQVQDVNRLLKQFDDMQRMMKKMKKGGMAKMMRSMKGMMPPGFPGR